MCLLQIFVVSPVGHLYNGFLKDSYSDPKVVAVFLNVGKSLVIVPFKHVLNLNQKNRIKKNGLKTLLVVYIDAEQQVHFHRRRMRYETALSRAARQVGLGDLWAG